MDNQFEIIDRCLIIHMTEEIDHHQALWLREEADKLIEKGNVKNIIFDFDGVQFMDSSGIGMIMGRYKKVIFTGGKIAVVSVGQAVDRIFKMSGLYKIVDKFQDLQVAMQEFN